MKRLFVLSWVALLLLACGDDDNKKLKAPANLTAEVVAEDQVILSWEDLSENETGFEIQRALQGEEFRMLTRADADATSLSDGTVALGAVYSYRIRAVSGTERSFYSNTAEVEVVVDRATAPTSPLNLQATEVTATTLALTWVDTATNETGFEIERSFQADFTNVDTLAADMNETRYEDSALTPETQYHYRVRAINAAGESAYSQPLAVQTAALPVSAPQAPADLSAQTVSPSRITLTWSDNSDNEEGFILMGSLDGSAFEQVVITAANVRTYSHEGLTPETTYYYKVLAFNSAGQSSESGVAQAETQPEPLTPPTAPDGLTHSELTSNSVSLTWADRSDDETGFRLERSQTDDFALVDNFTIDLNVTTYQDTNLLPSTDYYYRVLAFNQEGDSTYSDQIQVRTPDQVVVLPAPSALSLLDATALAITLTWQDNSENEEGFHLERAEDEAFTAATVIDIEADETDYEDSGLSADTTYYYRISAYLGQQTSDYGNTLEATTDPLPAVVPEAPALLQTTSVLHNRIALSWQDNADNEEGFHLERAEDEAFTAATVIDIEADETAYEDTGLTADTTYHYRIRAYNSVGNSPFTDPISASTETEPPVDASYIADYTVAKESVLRRIPQSAITAAKEDLKIMYCGTSHSSQVVDGMRGLMEYKSGDDSLYHVTFNGTAVSGALNIHYRPSGVYSTAQDLSHDSVDADGHTAYFRTTETYLDANTDCNVVMWSWCAIGGHDVTIYLDNFAELIEMYRAGGSKERTVDDAVTFVFMTGYASGSAGDTPEPPYTETPYQNYKRIRDYCETNGYYCLDYWTQDTYNYGDDSYKPTESGNTNVQHLAWVNDPAHELGSDWFECRSFSSGSVTLPAHANQHLTGNRRAYAAWWIFARIAGWDGTLD